MIIKCLEYNIRGKTYSNVWWWSSERLGSMTKEQYTQIMYKLKIQIRETSKQY